MISYRLFCGGVYIIKNSLFRRQFFYLEFPVTFVVRSLTASPLFDRPGKAFHNETSPLPQGPPHGVIKVRQSSNLSIVSEDEFDVEEGDLVAEAKFHYGRPFLDGQTKDWRSNSVLQKSLEILNRKIAF